jgi:hypothetical protein
MRGWLTFFFASIFLVTSLTGLADDDTGEGLIDDTPPADTTVSPEVLFLVILGGAVGDTTDTEVDSDNDGVTDQDDQCPDTPLGSVVDSDGCAQSQLDDDGDGVSNDVDQCPATPSGIDVDSNGCAQSQLDDDGDDVTNDVDQCPATPSGAVVDENGCAQSQLDEDGDGVTNDVDQCPATPSGADVDGDGCAQSQLDDDDDGVTNDLDQCPATPSDADVDGDGCAQSQLDDDDDGFTNDLDQCPDSPPGATVDEVGCEDRSAEVRAIYETDVNPLIVNTAGGCTNSGCHGRAGAPGGLRLYPSSDSNNVQLNYDALASYIGRRSGNTLLGKISGTAGHGGGARYLTFSSEYQIIEDWVRSVEALP